MRADLWHLQKVFIADLRLSDVWFSRDNRQNKNDKLWAHFDDWRCATRSGQLIVTAFSFFWRSRFDDWLRIGQGNLINDFIIR
jgi:hypothetical protein